MTGLIASQRVQRFIIGFFGTAFTDFEAIVSGIISPPKSAPIWAFFIFLSITGNLECLPFLSKKSGCLRTKKRHEFVPVRAVRAVYAVWLFVLFVLFGLFGLFVLFALNAVQTAEGECERESLGENCYMSSTSSLSF